MPLGGIDFGIAHIPAHGHQPVDDLLGPFGSEPPIGGKRYHQKSAAGPRQRLLHNKTNILIYTYSTDRYGRYVADIIADHIYINKTLVEKGHARYLSMRAD